MARTRVFRSRNSQAVRIQKQFCFSASEVELSRRNGEIVPTDKSRDLGFMLRKLPRLPRNFLSGVDDPPPSDLAGNHIDVQPG